MDYKIKRIQYINNWPNEKKFDVEMLYEEKYKNTNQGKPFIPYCMSFNTDEYYNKALSFMIDALESLSCKPNHSFEFIFTAYDIYSKSIFEIGHNITHRNSNLVSHWSALIENNNKLQISFYNLLKKIPQKSLQYIFSKLFDERIFNRCIVNSDNSENSNRKCLLTSIKNKYSNTYSDYATGIRPGSRLLYHVLCESTVCIDGITYVVSLGDKIHILISGFLYSLRNDSMHGSSISCTKSSLSKLSTMANSYFSFLLTYYFLLLLIIEKTSLNKSQDLSLIAENIDINLDNYIKLFGHSLSE